MLLGNDLETIIYMIPILLFAVAVHECMHATVAYWLGDTYQKIAGRMTLDPMKHFDPFGFLAILLIGFGWGKPVIVDDSNFKDSNRDNMLVSLAGPVSNLLIAIVFAIIYKILIEIGLFNQINNIEYIIKNFLVLGIQFNVLFFVFNLLPIPPFDGSKIVRYFLPYELKYKYDGLQRYTFFILLILIFTDILQVIILPPTSFIVGLIDKFIILL